MDINFVAMGQRIRLARKEQNISSEVLAEKINLAVESLWHIESGARKPSLQTLCNIAEVLNISLDYLIGRLDSPANAAVNSIANKHDLSEAQSKVLLELCKSMAPIIKNSL